MTFTLWMLVFLVAFIAWQLRAHQLVAATSEDWFVVFDVDAEEKILAIWFYPVVAFRLQADATTPVPSRVLHAAKAASMRPYKNINDTRFGASVSYGRWIRDNMILDDKGHPESERTFAGDIEDYLSDGFKLLFITTLPGKYAKLVTDVRKNIKNND